MIKRTLAVIVAMGLAAGCGPRGEAPKTESTTPEAPRVALVLKTLNSPFFLDMERGAQEAAKRLGVNLTVQKMLVFALSDAVAGFAGCMLGLSSGALRVDSFPLFAGLPLVLLLAVQGVRYPISAFMAVIGLALFPAINELLGSDIIEEKQYVGYRDTE